MTEAQRRADTLRAFDAAAADFAALGPHLWDPIGEATVAVAAPKPGQRVLDVCCGAGASAIPAARLVGPEGTVDGVDVSGPMVAEMGRRAADLPQLRGHQQDALQWQGTGYDIVQAALGIFFFPDMVKGTEKLVGMARPGGRAVFTIWCGDAMEAAGRYLARAVATATNTDVPEKTKNHVFYAINQAEPYATWLAERGLSDVDVVRHELSLEMTPELAWLVVVGSGFRSVLASLDAAMVETVRENYVASLRADGVTQLDATTLIGVGTVPISVVE